jgi:primosomal protein N' (replication factor Y) (superfamily II helicase)
VSLLIPTHALPPLSYRIPEHLRRQVSVGSAVVAPLSGRSRLGVVISTREADARAREDLLSVAGDLALPPDLIELCCWISENAAVPLSVVLRAALPPGLDTSRYRISRPEPGWPWNTGTLVRRHALQKILGRDGLSAAEAAGRLELVVGTPGSPRVEWALLRGGAEPDLGRAPRQRALYGLLRERGGESRVDDLLGESGSSRSILRELVRRGAVRLERRPEPASVFVASGEAGVSPMEEFVAGAGRVAGRGGAWLWRTPRREHPDAAAALALSAFERGEQTLVLAPEISVVDGIVQSMCSALPAGCTVAPYHAGIDRATVYQETGRGRVDVLVGTRAAALIPMPRLGAVCVVDEPNEAHRAEPGYEGLPLHVREAALERARIEGAGVLFLSPCPSLNLYAADAPGRTKVRELPARTGRPGGGWPAVRIVDVRSTGATLSSTLLDACRRVSRGGGRVGVLANRLGYASAVTCSACGAVRSCEGCGLRLAVRDGAGSLTCVNCGTPQGPAARCERCGSGRLSPAGVAVERVREELSVYLKARVGLLTAGRRDDEDAAVVVGTTHCVLEEEWEAVMVPDADALLQAPGVAASERAFRTLYGAAEAARRLLLVQTRLPEHDVLRAAVRGDYPAFAASELARLRAVGYPPYAHLAALTIEGREETVRVAVESRLRPAIEKGVDISDPVPVGRAGEAPAWRLLLRSPERPAVARAATAAARLVAGTGGLRARVEVDPEEV